jgi:signal transduction histidine kinase
LKRKFPKLNEQGTGLGLIICKEMLGLTGSELKVESFEKTGTTFYFSVPLAS